VQRVWVDQPKNGRHAMVFDCNFLWAFWQTISISFCGVIGPHESYTRRAYLFSAKGAAFSGSLGQRPRIRGNPETPALKARFTAGIAWIIIRAMLEARRL
jgi:hypothetical protein